MRECSGGAGAGLCGAVLLEGWSSLDCSPGGAPRAIPMEVNMPLAMAMLPDWNPTGPGKGESGTVSALLHSPAWKLAGSGEEQVTWIPSSLCPPHHRLPATGTDQIGSGFYFSGVYASQPLGLDLPLLSLGPS